MAQQYEHIPVLADECISGLAIKQGGIYIDGTIGGAGHALRILDRLTGAGAALIGIDRDEKAASVSAARLDERNRELGGYVRCEVKHSNFVDIENICNGLGIELVDGILLDLGVSSNQLDEAERGFSYRGDYVLDMRMDRSSKLTAADIVNKYPEKELAGIIANYGEERWAKRITEFIVGARGKKPILTTSELVKIILAAVPKGARSDGKHPAMRTFMALRIAVNNELGVIAETIKKSAAILKPGGRLCVISFHSLEDRIVKNTINELSLGCTCPKDFPVCVCGRGAGGRGIVGSGAVGRGPELIKVTRKPVIPGADELRRNPRARSAKLRIAEKAANQESNSAV